MGWRDAVDPVVVDAMDRVYREAYAEAEKLLTSQRDCEPFVIVLDDVGHSRFIPLVESTPFRSILVDGDRAVAVARVYFDHQDYPWPNYLSLNVEHRFGPQVTTRIHYKLSKDLDAPPVFAQAREYLGEKFAWLVKLD